MQSPENNETEGVPNSRRPSKDTLNLIIAASAVLISLASFVAAYVQSDAALRQVTAETWPFLQLDHGNTNADGSRRSIYFKLMNAGVGPSRVKNFQLYFNDQPIKYFGENFVFDCCAPEGMDYQTFMDGWSENGVLMTTAPIPPIIPSGGDVVFFDFPRNSAWLDDGVWLGMWRRLDQFRLDGKVTAITCYCSLLGDCFQSNLVDDPVEVDACYPAPKAAKEPDSPEESSAPE